MNGPRVLERMKKGAGARDDEGRVSRCPENVVKVRAGRLPRSGDRSNRESSPETAWKRSMKSEAVVEGETHCRIDGSVGLTLTCSLRQLAPLGFLPVFLACATFGCEGRALPRAGEELRDHPKTRISSALVRAPVGSREARPVVVALVAEETSCERASSARGSTFFVCLWGAPGGPYSERLREALQELKRQFPEHVAPRPVVLFAEAARTADVMVLAAEEPGFFSALVLERADRVLVSNTRLYSYGQKGGKRVALVGVPVEEELRARGLAPSARLSVEAFRRTPEGLAGAFRFAQTEGPEVH